MIPIKNRFLNWPSEIERLYRGHTEFDSDYRVRAFVGAVKSYVDPFRYPREDI
jgi:hypothetical protein